MTVVWHWKQSFDCDKDTYKNESVISDKKLFVVERQHRSDCHARAMMPSGTMGDNDIFIVVYSHTKMSEAEPLGNTIMPIRSFILLSFPTENLFKSNKKKWWMMRKINDCMIKMFSKHGNSHRNILQAWLKPTWNGSRVGIHLQH